MIKKRVKISSIVENQLPSFVREEYPLISTFLSQYYKSLDGQGSTYDILQNIDQYVKLDSVTNLIESTATTTIVEFGSINISVYSTNGFPDNNGIIQIDDEIILYESKNEEQFLNCTRGFSGITDYKSTNKPEELTFSTSSIQSHAVGSTVLNLSVLFLKEFFAKIKKQILPGFEDQSLYSDLDQNIKLDEENFIIRSKDFYSSKGTDSSFEILFKSLYGDPATVIKPRDFLIRPSDSEYKITKDIVVESITGNPEDLYNRTLFQNQGQGLTETFASVTNVEEIIRNGKTYYVLSLDFDYDRDISVRGSIFGDFAIHPKTKALDYVESGATQIIVDSTIGFPDSGDLTIKSISGNDLIVSYTSKNLNQFTGCTGIIEDISLSEDVNLNVYAYSILNEEEIKVRILGAIKDIELPNNSKYIEPGDIISFDTLGKVYDSPKYTQWLVSVPNTYNVSRFESVSDDQIEIFTYDKNLINIFDLIYIEFFDSQLEEVREELFEVTSVAQNGNSIFVKNQYQIEKIYHIRTAIKKYVNSEDDIITSNVQNVYVDESNDQYIASQSIPDYIDQNIEKIDFSINFFGIFEDIENAKEGISSEVNNEQFELNINQIHDFKTGDSVYYVQNASQYTLNDGTTINLNLYDGLVERQLYYVESTSDTKIKLYKSRSNIYFKRYNPIKYNRLYSNINLNEVTYTNSEKIDLLSKTYFLQSNEFVLLFDSDNNIEVWYYNYTSNTWEKIDYSITAKLYKSNYIEENTKKPLKATNLIKKISPPTTPISDLEDTPNGTTGILVNGVEILNYKSEDFVYYGEIEKIDIVSAGKEYDVINLPTLEISDLSSTKSCTAHLEITGTLQKVDVIDGGFDILEEPSIKILGGNGRDAELKANLINFRHTVDLNPTATFVNLSNNTIAFSTYHKFRDTEEVVYKTNGNRALGGISTLSSYFVTVQDDVTIKLHETKQDALDGIEINLTSYGDGGQELESKEDKRKISSITILNPGQGYKNNYVSVSPTGISTYTNEIIAKNHGYEDGDIVTYTCTGSYPEGLSQSKYYVTKVNEDRFKLSEIGVGLTSKDFYFNTNQYVNIASSGIGTHIFQHEPISLEVSAKIGISSYSKDLFYPVISPIFRGEITNVYVEDGGIGYGSSEILNYERQPVFTIKSGQNAQLIANVLNGVIKDVYVINGGTDYNSIPEFSIRGTGTGALLSPVIENGVFKDVIVVNGGSGYEQKNTVIEIINFGQGARFNAKIKSWNINLTNRILNSNNLISNDDGILYSNLPNSLKYSHLYCPNQLRKKIYSSFIDEFGNKIRRIDYDNSISAVKYHSPIIGWAYDGNPIYGPYGYSSPNSVSSIKKIRSGYVLSPLENRPPEIINNLVVFPYGIFIEDYKFTGDGDLDECNGRFCVTPEYPNGVYAYFCTVSNEDDFVPQFPYFIGNKYRSTKILTNFDPEVNQNTFNFGQGNIIRNTYYYALKQENSTYDFLLNPSKDTTQDSKVSSVEYSNLSSIGILTSGQNYKVGDVINFDSEGTNGYDVSAVVGSVGGKIVQTIENVSYVTKDVELYNSTSNIGICTSPHQLNDLDYINLIENFGVNSSTFIQVGISSQTLILVDDVADTTTTGIVTDFEVNGNLSFPSIMENDYYKLEDEVIKILQVRPEDSKIKVLRSVSGPSHLKTSTLVELTRKFTFEGNLTYNPGNINREYYFDPIKNVGFGTTSGSIVEVNYTGIGDTTLYIPPGNFYLPKHNLQTNTPLVYSENGGNPIIVSNGSSIFDLNSIDSLYAIKTSNDFIGISSNKVAIGTDGNYIGIGTTTSSLYITDFGAGVYHSFRTNYENVLKFNAIKNTINVSTASTHGLLVGDDISIAVKSGITTSIKIKYNDYNRRIIFNEKYFTNVDIIDNIFTLTDHGYNNGQELLYVSDSSPSELKDNQIYYILKIDNDRFKLAETSYDCLYLKKEIDFTYSFSGYFYELNSNIIIRKNQKVIFDLSDSSLSFIDEFITKSAFDFKLYYDKNFNKEYYFDSDGEINVTKFGNIGIDLNSRLELQVSDGTPNELYYNLIPVSNINLPIEKEEILVDSSIYNFNKITISESLYSGNYNIIKVEPNSFSYQTKKIIENLNYNSNNSNLNYNTISKTAFGPITSINLISGGNYYSKLPGITSITSSSGYDAVLYPISNRVGKIKSTKLEDIGYGYSVDPTVRPTIKLPNVFRVEPFSTIDEIKTTFKGKFYNYSPNLIVLDPITKEIQDVILDYDYSTGIVQIIKNSNGFNNVEPQIIPVNNSNGIGISSITYDPILKQATAKLNYNFTNPDTFPVQLFDEIYVENTSIIENSPDFNSDGGLYKGFNSSEYDYSTFNVVGLSTAIEDQKAYIIFYVGDVLDPIFEIGTFDIELSRGSVVPLKNTPTFEVKIKKNSYIVGEIVESNGSIGQVSSWDPKTNYIKIKTTQTFDEKSNLIGKTSASLGQIVEVIDLSGSYNIDYYSIRNKGWKTQTGFLNVNSQRIADNDYYQYFSYSIKSRVPIDKWESAVSALNHTSGFKKFSDFSVESESPDSSAMNQDQNEGNFTGVSDLNSIIDLETTYDFDLALEENVFTLNRELVSDEITLNSTILQDYSQSVGNRVLVIDDISGEFNTNRKSTFVTAIDI